MKAECPECKSNKFDIIDEEGGVDDSEITYKCACMDCECGFDITCDIAIKFIGKNED